MKSFVSFTAFLFFLALSIKAFQMSEPTMGLVFGGLALVGAAVWHGPLNSGPSKKSRPRRKGKGRREALPSFMSLDAD